MYSTDIQATYNIERLTKDNICDVTQLYDAVYHKQLAVDHFKKKYETADPKTSYLGLIVYTKQKLPIAFYGVIPCFIAADNRILPAAQSADAMTHPQYRNKGLFTALEELIITLCRDNGILFHFVFPNQNSLPILMNKSGWKKAEQMDLFIIPVKTISLDKLAIKFTFIKPLYRQYSKWVLQKYLQQTKGIANSICNEGYAGVYRDDHFLNYKANSSTRVIKIEGSLIWIKIGNGLIIGDVELARDEGVALITNLIRLGKRLGTKQIMFHVSPGTGLHTLFAKRFNAIPSFQVMYKDLESGIPPDKIKFTSADFDFF